MLTTSSPHQSHIRADAPMQVADSASFRSAAVFTIAARVLIYIIVALSLVIGITPTVSFALSLTLIALLALSGKRAMALGFVIFTLIFFAIYLAMFATGLHFFVFSPPRILQLIGQIPSMIAFFFIVTAPCGLISSALAKIRLPKKIIIGVLVIVRFFPTLTSFWKRYRDAVRTRGLLTPSATIRNPMNALEYVIVPIMLSLATSADQLSTSAIARAAEAPTSRSSYYQQTMQKSDFLAIALVTLVCAGCIGWTKAGLP